MDSERTFWRLCSSCKRELAFGSTYYVCSVSTCNRKRMALTFCSLPCFEAHVPTVRHREAWAEQERAPTRQQFEQELAQEEAAAQASAAPSPAAPAAAPQRRIVGSSQGAAAAPEPVVLEEHGIPREILIVVSKLKAYIRARSGMNTSDAAMEVLSDHVRTLCDSAIRHAGSDGRKTVLPRDF